MVDLEGYVILVVRTLDGRIRLFGEFVKYADLSLVSSFCCTPTAALLLKLWMMSCLMCVVEIQDYILDWYYFIIS